MSARSALTLALHLGFAALPGAVSAETLAVRCAEAAGSPAMTLAYEGSATAGAVTISGTFGTMKLSSIRHAAEVKVGDGKPLAIVTYRASGSASVVMPDKAALESCVRSRLRGDPNLDDKDVVFVTALSCAQSVPASAGPVSIQASVEILTDADPETAVIMKRTYSEPTTLAGGQIVLDSMPNTCKADR